MTMLLLLMFGGLAVALWLWYFIWTKVHPHGNVLGFLVACMVWYGFLMGAAQYREVDHSKVRTYWENRMQDSQQRAIQAANEGNLNMARQWAKDYDESKWQLGK